MPTPAGNPSSSPAPLLIERVENLRRSKPARALSVLTRGFGKASRGAGPRARGELWRLRGHVLRSLRRAAAAASAYRRAERWFASARDGREVGRCAIGLTDALMYLGRYDEAQRAAARGRTLLARAGDRAALARLLNNQGNLFHRLDRPERALACYRGAGRALARAGDRQAAGLIETNVGNCLSLLGRSREARRAYGRARKAGVRAGFALDTLRADYNLAYLDFLELRHEAALEGLSRVAAESRRISYPSIEALAALDRAEILLQLGDHEQALEEAERAVVRCTALGLGYERAKAETFAALAQFRLGRTSAARMGLENTLAAFHAEGNAVWTGEALVGLATLWGREGNPRAAAALLQAARRQFARAGDREREGCALALLARARLGSRDERGAGAALGALRAQAPGLSSPRLRHLALAAEAALATAQGDRGRARRLLERAARESERLAARVLDEQWRSSFWGEWGWPHRELAALELEAGRVAESLEALERGRGLTLVGDAYRGGRGAREPLPRRVREWAAALKARETARAAAPQHGPGRPAAGRVRDAVIASGVKRELDRRPAGSIRADELQRRLPEGLLLLDYLLHDGALSAIALTRDRIAGLRGLASGRRVSELTHSLLFTLRGAAFAPSGERVFDDALRQELTEIASLALWPALDHDTTRPRALGVVPVGPLTRVPWPALSLPDGRALCEELEVLVVPGLRLGLAAGTDREPRGAPLVVAVGDEDLESIEPESRAVLEAFPDARVLRGPEATASRFLKLAPEAAWIHFAGHGVYRAEAPHESGLRFADRWVHAGELAGLRLAARWVCLSACQTARALVRPGEEWFGLGRAFLLAGARAVVASQWDIEDQAARRLMADLYPRLAHGEPLTAALARVQAGALARGAHPLEWAGFVVLGGPESAGGARVREARTGRRGARSNGRRDSLSSMAELESAPVGSASEGFSSGAIRGVPSFSRGS